MIPFYKRIGYEYIELSDSTHGGAAWHKMMYRLKNRNMEKGVRIPGKPYKKGLSGIRAPFFVIRFKQQSLRQNCFLRQQ